MVVERSPERRLGAYLHVPFCERRCDYCDFATWTDRAHLIEDYLDALAVDVRRGCEETRPLDSVFVGGGTPTLVPASRLAEIVGSMPLAPHAEVTVEANPDSVTAESLRLLADAGVNRLSLGVQSMVPHVLSSLGRTHEPDNVRRARAWAADVGIERVSVDLIYGAAGESLADWETSVAAALDLEADHVSAYALTIEPGTPLAAERTRHPDDDDQVAKYELADDILTAQGLGWYEISNWSRPGQESRHNLLYWTEGDYMAFGCAAHGHQSGRRWWNVRTPERYIAAIEAGRSPEAAHEVLDPADAALEHLQLALRTRRGVPRAALEGDEEVLAALVELNGDRWVLTRPGRLLASEVALRLAVPSTVEVRSAGRGPSGDYFQR